MRELLRLASWTLISVGVLFFLWILFLMEPSDDAPERVWGAFGIFGAGVLLGVVRALLPPR